MNNIKNYSVICEQDDPTISIKLPSEILIDLVLRAEENGTSVEVELAIRLARSLENDLRMIDADNEMARKAFSVITNKEVK